MAVPAAASQQSCSCKRLFRRIPSRFRCRDYWRAAITSWGNGCRSSHLRSVPTLFNRSIVLRQPPARRQSPHRAEMALGNRSLTGPLWGGRITSHGWHLGFELGPKILWGYNRGYRILRRKRYPQISASQCRLCDGHPLRQELPFGNTRDPHRIGTLLFLKALKTLPGRRLLPAIRDDLVCVSPFRKGRGEYGSPRPVPY